MKLTIASVIVAVVSSGCLEVPEADGVNDEGLTIDPIPWPPPDPIPIPYPVPCGSITSFSPASAQPGDVVDIYLPGVSHPFYSITGAGFAPGVPAAALTVVDYRHARATVPMNAITGHVRITCHFNLTNTNGTIESTTDFTRLAIAATPSPASATLDYGATTTISVALARPAPQAFPLTLTPSSAALSLNGGAAGAPVALAFGAGQSTASFTVGGVAAGAATVAVSGPSIAPASISITVRSPSFTLAATPASADVHWGNSASYTVTLQGSGGLSGNIALTATGLPAGASAAPVNVTVPLNGQATATFVVATTTAATALGTDSFTLRATHAVATARTRTLDVRVLPSEGAFASMSWQTATGTCGAMTATVGASMQGPTVRFSGPGFAGNGIPFLYYAFTPSCRAAVVYGSGPSVQLYNLGFPATIADSPGSQVTNFGGGAYDNNLFRISPDDSYVVVVADLPNGNRSANLYSMLDGSNIPPSRTFLGSLTLNLVGDEVQGTPSNSNAFSWGF